MGFKRDREGSPEYDVESDEAVLASGPGGEGNRESLSDALRRGVTPELARKLAEEAATAKAPDADDDVEHVETPAGPQPPLPGSG
ncbi:hypothetical protein [Labrys wisconsinensis]|uniref:Uncharacterized protein n=1 Tax=Labrys wisconsinensis TaxID=425677 RepID=A0ABU0JE58_9HYPH|nr:hypothetical protein [Labrys wisconsinensis]MDQ0471915.1 hypothetical protein [Labrys wisconsinensis]